MKTILTILTGFGLSFFLACHSTKKSIKPASSDPVAVVTTTPTNTVVAGPAPMPKSKNGIYAPGHEELQAIQGKYPDATSAELTEGYTIYSKGACTNCHSPKSIYTYNINDWKGIIDDMATRAYLSAGKKEAVYKYVLAIKATQGQ